MLARRVMLVTAVPPGVAAAVRAMAHENFWEVRTLLLRALAAGGVDIASEALHAAKPVGRQRGPKPSRTSTRLGFEMKETTRESLRCVARSRGLSERAVLLKGLAQLGITVPPHEYMADRRSKRSARSRLHYASCTST